MQEYRPDGSIIGVPALHIDHSVTTVLMEPGFDHPELVNLSLETDNDRQLWMIAQLLPDEHLIYAIGLQQLEQIVQVHAGGTKPAWVDSDDPEFTKALARYFNCGMGEPTG